MNKDSIIDFLGFIIVKILGFLLCLIPLGLALWIGRRGGDFVYLVNSKRRSIAYANLKSAFPEKRASEIKGILRSHFGNLGMSVMELLRLPLMAGRYLDSQVTVENADRIKAALDRGKGIILLAAHFGNWEVGSLAVSAKGYRMSVFAREQKYKRLNNLLNKSREMTGGKVISKGFSVREVIKTLHNNGIVAMIGDQDAGSNGVFVDFLNRPASTAQGPVVFGLKTGAAILPAFVLRRAGFGEHVLEIGRPLELVNTGDKKKDIRTNLEKITDVLEDYIKRFPEQWLWSHKRWKSTPQRTILVLSDGKQGHLNQAMAVAEMAKEALASMLKRKEIHEKPIVKIRVAQLRFKNRFMRILLDITSLFSNKRCQGCLKCLKFCLRKESFDEVRNIYADVIISCGASTIGASLFLKNENNAKGIVIMKPGLGRSRKFDAVILPRHDAPKRLLRNMLITESAPNRITEGAIRDATLRTTNDERRTTKPGIGLLIGGDTKSFKLTKEAVGQVMDGISKIAEEMDLDISVSTSRRTSAEIDAFLKDRLSRDKRCKLLVIANERNIAGAVPAIFGLSKVVVVSPDSISMISEAASSGRHAVVFRREKPGTRNQDKHERTIANLETKGYIKTAMPDEIYSVIKMLLRDAPAVKKLEDREGIVKRLEAII